MEAPLVMSTTITGFSMFTSVPTDYKFWSQFVGLSLCKIHLFPEINPHCEGSIMQLFPKAIDFRCKDSEIDLMIDSLRAEVGKIRRHARSCLRCLSADGYCRAARRRATPPPTTRHHRVPSWRRCPPEQDIPF
jgi:hypothetical protein